MFFPRGAWLSRITSTTCYSYISLKRHAFHHSFRHPLTRKTTALFILFIISDFSLSVVKYNMVSPVSATSTIIPDPCMEESSVRITPGAPYVHSMKPLNDEARPGCIAQRERELLNQDLERFWAHQRNEIQNSTGFHVKDHLPLSRIKRVMKSDPEVKLVSSETPVLLAKACEIFIQEITLHAWRQTQSCSRQTIRSTDVYEALKNSKVYEELVSLVSFQPPAVSHKNEPQHVVHQQMVPLANVNEPKTALNVNVPEKAPIDIDMIQQQTLFNLTVDDFIIIDDFELGPHIK